MSNRSKDSVACTRLLGGNGIHGHLLLEAQDELIIDSNLFDFATDLLHGLGKLVIGDDVGGSRRLGFGELNILHPGHFHQLVIQVI